MPLSLEHVRPTSTTAPSLPWGHLGSRVNREHSMGVYCKISAAPRQDLGPLSAAPNAPGVPFGRTRTAGLSVLIQNLWRGLNWLLRHLLGGSVHSVSLEKSWHGLHYLLTGEAWAGNGTLAFLAVGGEQLGDADEMPSRWFTPDDTVRIYEALSGVSDENLWSRFNADEMERLDIYPGIWDEGEQDLKKECLTYFRDLRRVVATAVQSGQGLLVRIR